MALLRKRAGEVSRQWPMLAAGLGDRWESLFAAWAAARPTQGSLRDGFDLARDLLRRGDLPVVARAELAGREVSLSYDGASAPAPRRGPALRTAAGAIAVKAFGRTYLVRG